VPFEELKARQSEAWGSAPWENVAPQLAPVHEHLARVLEPRPRLRWLDIGTGTGALAQLAAHGGAVVTAVDLAPRLLETARRLADAEGLVIDFRVGDAEALDVADGSFEVISSAMGLFLAPDHAAVAHELGRVCEQGGRIGFTAWRRDAGFMAITRKYTPPLQPGQGDAADWGSEEYVERMLADAFELRFEDGDSPMQGESGEALWELTTTSVGPVKARTADMEPEVREQFHREFVDFFESHRVGDGVRASTPYLLVLGTRR